ncbi:imelysin family protein [Catenovulum sediminis]|uniref:Imelysin family protein n=1 Tax=Catenovulum sediminis TaxID=1740262 RepID=A0ABV1RIQ9_9ALTE
MNLTKKTRNALSAVSLIFLSACGESTSSKAGPEYGLTSDFTENELITHLVDQVIKPRHESFSAALAAQEQSLEAYCTTIETQTDSSNALTQVQNDFTALMASWQQIEVMQMTPLSENSAALRNTIYSWPRENSCAVDQDVAFNAEGSVNGQNYDISKRSDTRKGLDAFEYLIYNQNLTHSCSLETGALVGWNQLDENTRKIQRCDFAKVVLSDLKTRSDELQVKWYTADNAYQNELKNGDPRSAINTLGQALFYADYQIKDQKLGMPLGYFNNQCGNAPCAAEVESKHAKLAIKNLQNNLIAFEALFTGKTSEHAADSDEAIGFDDYLQAVGDSETSEVILTALQNAQTQLADIQSDFATALTNQNSDFEKIEALHAQIKVITDQLKTHFITSLSVELPDTSAGDND